MVRSKHPEEAWPNGFGASRLESLYTRELYWLAYRIDERCARLFTKHPNDPKNFYASADTSSLDLAFDALADASKFRELLFPGRSKPIYEERAAHLRSLLKDVDYSVLIDKKVRNTLEHFPEYLDDANYSHSAKPGSRLYGVAFNFVFSHLYEVEVGQFPFPAYLSPLHGLSVFPVRVFVATTQTVHNFLWSVNLGAIAHQARQVKSAISKLLGEPKPEDWVSGIIAIGPTGA